MGTFYALVEAFEVFLDIFTPTVTFKLFIGTFDRIREIYIFLPNRTFCRVTRHLFSFKYNKIFIDKVFLKNLTLLFNKKETFK